MTSPARNRAGTSSPASRISRDDLRKDHSPYRHHPRNSSSAIWEEFNNLMISEDRTFQKQQDELDAEQQKLHKQALEQAAAEHERVRQNAERARERVELEIERERKRREDEELRALEAERKAKAERDATERRRMKEDLERQEQEQRKRAAEEKEIHESQARLAEQKRKDEADAVQRKREQEEADRKAKEDAAAAAAAAAQPASKPAQPASAQPIQPAQPTQSATATGAAAQTQPTVPATVATAAQPSTAQPPIQPTPQAAAAGSTVTSSATQREELHKQYIALHQRLKTMRRTVIAQCKSTPALKNQLGDWRRLLTRTMGQLTLNQAENRVHMAKVTSTLTAAAAYTTPSVDVSSFILSVPTDGTSKFMSGPLVYLLNIVAKAVISQMINEASVSAKISEPLGVMAITIFSQPVYRYDGTISLIDILLAKYHVVCPVLWGIYGNEKKASGRERIGWWKEDGDWMDEQLHINRMTGLATGYASLTLRDFSKSKNTNPYPPSNYWKALSYIVNTPPAELQPTHFIVLKALIDGHIPRFLSFYGQAGLVALRKALIEVPASAPTGAARNALMVLPQTIQRDMKLTL